MLDLFPAEVAPQKSPASPLGGGGAGGAIVFMEYRFFYFNPGSLPCGKEWVGVKSRVYYS
jgi:hypothetical protein